MMAFSEIKPITYAQFRQMEFEENEPAYVYELINGLILKRSSPTTEHQSILGNLYFQLRSFLQNKEIGKILLAPLDVMLDEANVPQPDLVFVALENEHIIKRKSCIEGVPDMIVEVVSRGSIRKDRITKKELYERFGVKEYWIIDQNSSVEVYYLEKNVYKIHSWIEEEGIVTSKFIEGFQIDMKDLFDL